LHINIKYKLTVEPYIQYNLFKGINLSELLEYILSYLLIEIHHFQIRVVKKKLMYKYLPL